MPARARPAAILGILLLGMRGAPARAFLSPGQLVVSDFKTAASGASQGALFQVDLQFPDPSANAAFLAGPAPFRGLMGCIVWSRDEILCADSSADPSGFGRDPGPFPDGPGAVFLVDLATGEVRTLSDGSSFDGSLPAGRPTVFVSPRDLAMGPDGSIYLVDMDADPSGLGADVYGYPGHGAVFRVDPGSGQVSLVSDGSLVAGGLPPGTASVFESPNSVAALPDGRLLVADEWANPNRFPVPPFLGSAVFLVDSRTGEVEVLVSSESFAAVFDACLDPLTGTTLISDYGADPAGVGRRGAIFRYDPLIASLTPVSYGQNYIDLQGILCREDGNLWAVDGQALRETNPPRQGVVFEVLLQGGLPPISNSVVRSADEKFRYPRWVAQVPAGVAEILSVSPDHCCPGETMYASVLGTGFEPGDWIRFGPGIATLSVTVDSETQITAEIRIEPEAAPGPRQARLVKRSGMTARLDDAFRVTEGPGAGTIGAVANGCTVQLTMTPPEIPDCGGLTFELHRANVSHFEPDTSTLLETQAFAIHFDPLPSNGVWCYRARTRCGSSVSPDASPAACVYVESGCGGPGGRPEAVLFPPGAPRPHAPSPGDLSWQFAPAVGADRYRAFRGTLAPGGGLSSHASPFSSCGGDPECDLRTLSFTDCGVLGDGGSYYYLVIGVSASGVPGSPGTDSAGAPRAAGSDSCPP